MRWLTLRGASQSRIPSAGRAPAQDDDETGDGGQHQVADQRGPASGSRVQLAETVAVGLSSTRQIVADACHKEQQQASAPKAPHQAEMAGMSATATASSASGNSVPKGVAKPRRDTKVAQGLPRASQIGQLGESSHKKNERQQQAGAQQEENSYLFLHSAISLYFFHS